jgi:hypothetical protein
MKLDLDLSKDHEKTIKTIIDNNEVQRIIIEKKELEITTKTRSVHTFPLLKTINK